MSGHNTTNGISYQQSNTVLPVINSGFGTNNALTMSATSSPMKVGFNYYSNNVMMGDGDTGNIANKSHSVAARAVGLVNNGAGILERDEVSPSFNKIQSFLNQEIRSSNFFKGKVVGSLQGASSTKTGFEDSNHVLS